MTTTRAASLAAGALEKRKRPGPDTLFQILARIASKDEAVAFHAYQSAVEHRRVPELLLARLGSCDSAQARLDLIREYVRIAPEIRFARAQEDPGWPDLRAVLYPESSHGSKEARVGRQATRTRKSKAGRSVPRAAGSIADSPADLAASMRAHPGRWIAWDDASGTVLAIEDTFAKANSAASQANGQRVRIEIAPGFHPQAEIHQALELLDWESPNVLDDVWLLWGDRADAWLDSVNLRLGGRKPRELVGSPDERWLRYLLRAMRDGVTS